MYRRFYGLLTTDMGFKYIISHCIVCHFKNCSCLLCLLLRGAYGTIRQPLPAPSSLFLPRYITVSLFLSLPGMGFPQHFHGPFIPNPPEPPRISSSQELPQLSPFTPGMGAQQQGCAGARVGLRFGGSPTLVAERRLGLLAEGRQQRPSEGMRS